MLSTESFAECAVLRSPTSLLCLLLLVSLSFLLWQQRRCWQVIWQINGWRGVLQQPLLWLLLCVYLDPKSLLQTICRLRKYFRRPVVLLFGNRVLLYVDDPANMERILNAPECVDKTFMHDGFFARRGLLHARGQKWKIRRKQLNPAFSHNILLSFFGTFNAVANQMQKKFAQQLRGDAIRFRDVEELLSRAVLEVSCLTTMGTATNFTLKDEEGIARMYKELLSTSAERVIKPWLQCDLLFRLLEPQAYTTSCRNNQIVEQFVNNIVQRKHAAWQQKRAAEQNVTAGTTTQAASDSDADDIDATPVHRGKDTPMQKRIFIEQIFHLADAGALSLQDIVDEANSMVLVSFETVSNSIIIALLCLAAHPACQHKLREEINAAFAANGGVPNDVDAAQLRQLKYLDMVVQESLRLLTTIPMNLRQVSRDFQLCIGRSEQGRCDRHMVLTLPRHTMLLLDSFNMQRDEALWGPRAQQFYPPHFEEQATSDTAGRHPYAFIPFSKGIRSCIGQRYSIFLLKIFLVKLIFAFEFRTTAKLEQLRFVEGISLKFQNSEQITFAIKQLQQLE